jgi:hypothetical protein
MAGPWLYTISARARRTFDVEGVSIPVTVDSYRELVRNERIKEDRWWSIAQHWRHVEKGDELFIYTGDQDLGIIGYATVNDKVERNGHWCLLPRFELDRCRKLLNQPICAAVVRQWVHFPRKNVIDLAPFKEQLCALLPW